MTTLRSRIFIIASVVLLVILAISIFLVVLSKKKAAAPGTTTTPSNVIDQTNFNGQINASEPVQLPSDATVKPLSTEEQMKNAARQMAKIFTERYNTYSSDSDFSNIREVETLVTSNLWNIISKKMTAGQTGGEFIGMTTKVATAELIDWQIDRATVTISARRTETKGVVVSEKNQQAIVQLVKSNGNWLVDNFEWK